MCDPGGRLSRRILQIMPASISTPSTGAQLRNYHLSRQLSRTFSLTSLAFGPEPTPGDSPAAGPVPWDEVITVPRDPHYSVGKLLRSTLMWYPVTVLNYRTAKMGSALARLLDCNPFDIVQIEGLHLTTYLPVIRSARRRPSVIVCDWHNIESELMYRYSVQCSGRARRLYARWTAGRLAALERSLLKERAIHLVVSDRERECLLRLNPRAHVRVVENGTDVEYYSDENIARASGRFSATPAAAGCGRYRILFVGIMSYHANVDAVTWFAQRIWPEIKSRLPEAVFTVVGRDPAPEIRALAAQPGIEITGWVQDVRPYYQDALAVVAPLRIGGGTRLKILEAMAAGVPVVSTRLGAEGLNAQPGTHYVAADTADEFWRRTVALALAGKSWGEMTTAARVLVRHQYDWNAIGRALADFYVDILPEHRQCAG